MSDKIKCPVCNVDMVTVTVADTDVDRCTKCMGIWFDILEHEDLRKVKGAADIIDKGARNTKLDSEGKIINCPHCKTRMSPTHDAEQPHIVYEKCSSCSGVFFDAGEFSDLQDFKLSEKLKYWAG